MLNEFRAYIIADPTVSGLIGSRMYPNTAPQNPAIPYVTYQPVSATRAPTLRHADNLPAKRIQIDAWSTNVESARSVAEAIRALFHYYEQGMAEGIQGVFVVDEREDYESETLLHRVSADFVVHYAEN